MVYNDNEITIISSRWSEISSMAEDLRDISSGTEIETLEKIYKIVFDFIKEKGLKIYGGYAIHLLTNKSIYKTLRDLDIDAYSNSPITNGIELSNRLHEAGFKNVTFKEALHQETYKIFVNFKSVCDLSYMATKIFREIPYLKVDGFLVSHPRFLLIDIFKMLTDPINSYWRMDNELKPIRRLKMLWDKYPLEKGADPNDVEITDNHSNVIKIIHDIAAELDTFIFTNVLAYNFYCKKVLPLQYVEVISCDISADFKKMIEEIKKRDAEIRKSIKWEEYYPFSNILGRRVSLFYNDVLLLTMYSNDGRSIPIIKGKSILNDRFTISYTSFQTTILFILSTLSFSKINKENNILSYGNISLMIEEREKYLKEKKKNILDDTKYKDFVMKLSCNCLTLEQKRKHLIDFRKRTNKKLTFIYEPSNKVIPPVSDYRFLNSSGSIITNESNMLFKNIQ